MSVDTADAVGAEKVEPMKKLVTRLAAGTSSDNYTFTPEPVTFSFIYGIGRQGLTTFEENLSGKKQGDVFQFSLTSAQAQGFFGALWNPLCLAAGISLIPAEIHIRLEILDIVDADNREVVKALAGSLGHGGEAGGCGGSCGCGC